MSQVTDAQQMSSGRKPQPIFWWCLAGVGVCLVVAGGLSAWGSTHGIPSAAVGTAVYVGGSLVYLGAMLREPSWPFSRLWPFFAVSLALGVGAFWSQPVGMAWWVMVVGLLAAALVMAVPLWLNRRARSH